MVGVAVAAMALPVFGQAAAQPVPTYPGPDYYISFSPFYQGNYGQALQAFKNAGNGGVRSTEGRWVDSICYFTMVGECYYHTGNLALALENYEAALKLAVVHNGWLLRVQFPDTVNENASNARARITWGTSNRKSKMGSLPDKMLVMQGRLDNANVAQQGGVLAPPQMFQVRVQEIIRCTVLALRRRNELLGPVAPHDPLSSQLVQAFAQRSTAPNHWSQAWNCAELGLAYVSAGRSAQAIVELQQAILLAGQYDHNMTGTVLLELGKLLLAQGNHQSAANYFFEATLAAGQFGEADVVEEAFRYGLTTHIVSGQKGAFAAVVPAGNWARTDNYFHLQASCAVLAAESLCAQGKPGPALAAIGDAARLCNRRDMAGTDVTARFHYTSALISFQQGNTAIGSTALASALAWQRNGSRRLFQIGLVDRMYLSGSITPRIANDLFGEVLRDPTPTDWSHEPMESLAVSATPYPIPIEHWFELALARKEVERALEIADFARRHRFYSTMPLGGRLLALNYILEAPEAILPDDAKLQKQDLLARYPLYGDLARESKKVRTALGNRPLLPAVGDALKSLEAEMAQLTKVSATQEALMREMALRRQGSQYVFPPIRKTKELQAEIAPGQLVLVFFQTSTAMHVFVVSHDKYANWMLEPGARLAKPIGLMLQSFGQYDRNTPLTSGQIRDPKRKTAAAEALKLLFKNVKPEALAEFQELVVVPDGPAWYIPFEALELATGETSAPLISKMRVRYAPMLSLIVPDKSPRRPTEKTGVVLGKLTLKEDDHLAGETLEALKARLPGTVGLSQMPAPGMAAKICDRLIVLSEIDDAKGPYDWVPVPVERGKSSPTVGTWTSLPFGGPQQVVFPGFHTPAEYGMKRGGNGEEMFLSVMAMMASGTRTVLLSRWRTGGQSAHDLTREFAQELPHSAAAQAWQRAVQLSWRRELDPTREVRANLSTSEAPINAEHPFFWAGYLLVDTGLSPVEKEEPVKEKVLEVKGK